MEVQSGPEWNHVGSWPGSGSSLLTIPEAAAAFANQSVSIYRLFDAGELCWVCVCGIRRISTAEIGRYIAAHTEAAS